MSSKRFKDMGEVDDYLEKQIQNEKRFSYEYSSETAMIVIIDNQKPYPNRWSMCNIEQTVRTLNEFNEENEQLRKEHQEMLEKYVLLRLKIGEVLNDE